MKMLRWTARVAFVVYVLACIAALGVLLVGTRGWFGVPPDGLAAVYALVLAMPWSLGFFTSHVESEGLILLLIVGSMALNGALLWGAGSLLRPAAK